jgi:predicted nucleic acid-binding protein
LDDEPYIDHAVDVFAAFSEGHIDLIVPQHIRYEVANALRNAVRRRRFPVERARVTLMEFLELDIPIVSGHGLISRAWDVAQRYDCPFYDGLYVALSDTTSLPFIHADRRLRNSLGGRFPQEIWIERFQVDIPDPA